MNKAEILDRAIDRAKKNGWQHPYRPDVENCYELLFNHDFLKALWGELTYYPLEHTDCNIGCDFCAAKLKVWQYHAQQMVVSDVFSYLNKFAL